MHFRDSSPVLLSRGGEGGKLSTVQFRHVLRSGSERSLGCGEILIHYRELTGQKYLA